jgi:hypothetical protein
VILGPVSEEAAAAIEAVFVIERSPAVSAHGIAKRNANQIYPRSRIEISIRPAEHEAT